jgi:hypothetical protein
VRAAFGGDSLAQTIISEFYHNGKGTAKNLTKSFFYAMKSADQGTKEGLALLADKFHWQSTCNIAIPMTNTEINWHVNLNSLLVILLGRQFSISDSCQ